jgi:hypothetical protein
LPLFSTDASFENRSTGFDSMRLLPYCVRPSAFKYARAALPGGPDHLPSACTSKFNLWFLRGRPDSRFAATVCPRQTPRDRAQRWFLWDRDGGGPPDHPYHGIKSFLNLFLYLEAAGFISAAGAVDPLLRIMVLDPDRFGNYSQTPLREFPSLFSSHPFAYLPSCARYHPPGEVAYWRDEVCLSPHVVLSSTFGSNSNVLSYVPWRHDLDTTQPTAHASSMAARRFARFVLQRLVPHSKYQRAPSKPSATPTLPECNVTIETRKCYYRPLDRTRALVNLAQLESDLRVEGRDWRSNVRFVCLGDRSFTAQARAWSCLLGLSFDSLIISIFICSKLLTGQW